MSTSESHENRQHQRYVADFKIYFDIPYDVEKKVTFTVKEQEEHKKYLAFTKNVSTEGICFISHKELNKGTFLSLEVHLDNGSDPIPMEGEVRWCTPMTDEKNKTTVYNTGIKLFKVKGAPVFDSIHYDEKRSVEWSNVLDSVFGKTGRLV